MFQRTIGLYRASFGGLPREIWSLSAVMLINRSGTMVIPFLTIYLTQTLGFSLVQAGYVMSFFGAGSLVGTILGGRLTDRIGQYPVQMGSLNQLLSVTPKVPHGDVVGENENQVAFFGEGRT